MSNTYQKLRALRYQVRDYLNVLFSVNPYIKNHMMVFVDDVNLYQFVFHGCTKFVVPCTTRKPYPTYDADNLEPSEPEKKIAKRLQTLGQDFEYIMDFKQFKRFIKKHLHDVDYTDPETIMSENTQRKYNNQNTF